jgi:hypothetical protein
MSIAATRKIDLRFFCDVKVLIEMQALVLQQVEEKKYDPQNNNRHTILCNKILLWNFHAEFICKICEACKACETKMVDKNGDWWCALSVTCHEKEVYFVGLKFLRSLQSLRSMGSVRNDPVRGLYTAKIFQNWIQVSKFPTESWERIRTLNFVLVQWHV